MKKFALVLAVVLLITAIVSGTGFAAFADTTKTTASTKPSNAIDAKFTTSKIYIDGTLINFDAYLIKGNNYLKLRDLAYKFTDTQKKFDVKWDSKKSLVNIISNSKYTVNGGEMKQTSKATWATLSTNKFTLDNKSVSITSYLINGNNYLKLRDLAQLLNFGLVWDGTTSSVFIDTTSSYVADEVTPTPTYLTVGEMSKYVIQSYLTNDTSTDYLHYAKLMISEGYFAEEDVAKYNDSTDMSRLATRAELARVLTVYYILSNGQNYFPEDVVNTFTDISKSDEVTYFYCNAAIHYKLMTSPSKDKFNPTGKITKDDLFYGLTK